MENVLRMYLEGAVRVRYLVKSYGMGTLLFVEVDKSFISSLELSIFC